MINDFLMPKYQTFPEITGILGILTALGRSENWIYNNYLLLWSNKRNYDDNYWCDFKHKDYLIDKKMYSLDFTEYDKSIFTSKGEVIFFLKNLLNEGYIITDIDMFYFDEWWSSDSVKEHNSHAVTIFGDNGNEFLCADFLKSKYNTFKGAYEDIAEAFFRGNNKIYGIKDTKLSLKKSDVMVKQQIMDFIHSSGNSVSNYLNLYMYENTLYGFDALKNILSKIMICLNNNEFVDLRSIQLISTLVKVMKERVEYWQKTELKKTGNITIQICNELESRVFSLMALCMRANYKKKYNEEFISNLTDEIIELMEKLFENLLEYLDIRLSPIDYNILWNNWDKLKKDDVKLNLKKISEFDFKAEYLYFEKIKTLFNKCLSKPNKLNSAIREIKNECREVYTDGLIENVFMLENEEQGLKRNGSIINLEEYNKQECGNTYYYDNMNRVKLIKSKNKNMKNEYFIYDYQDGGIFRYRVEEKTGVLKQITFYIKYKNQEAKYVYSPVYMEYVQYEMKNERKNKAYICKTKNTDLPYEKWINVYWVEENKYIYDKDNKLLQIIKNDYEGNNRLIYSDLDMHLSEGEIEKNFEELLESFVKKKTVNENSEIIVNFDVSNHVLTINDMKNHLNKMSFLEEYNLYEEAINRFITIFSITIYKFNKNNNYKLTFKVNNNTIVLEKQILEHNKVFTS